LLTERKSLSTIAISENAEQVADKFELKLDFTQGVDTFHFDVNVFRQELKVNNAETTTEIARWIWGVGMLQMALIAGLALKLTH
jgi:hypothetical protein